MEFKGSESLEITETCIKWEERKRKWDCDYRYEYEIRKVDDRFSIIKNMYINEQPKDVNLCFVPLELIEEMKNLKPLSND